MLLCLNKGDGEVVLTVEWTIVVRVRRGTGPLLSLGRVAMDHGDHQSLVVVFEGIIGDQHQALLEC